ncbi:MAG: restriction endonuclease subunit S [Fimbriimonadaceae bacterium]
MTWSVVPIGTAARVVSGATPSTSCPEYWGGSICWATPKDISELNGSKFLDDTPRKLTEAGLRSCSAEVLPPNSVLFSSRAPIGLVAINRVPTATNQGFKSFVPDPSKLDTGYLFHWLRAHRAQIERMGVGATFSEVSKAIVSRIEIPLPPIEVQREIVKVLDTFSKLEAELEARRKQYEHYRDRLLTFQEAI